MTLDHSRRSPHGHSVADPAHQAAAALSAAHEQLTVALIHLDDYDLVDADPPPLADLEQLALRLQTLAVQMHAITSVTAALNRHALPVLGKHPDPDFAHVQLEQAGAARHWFDYAHTHFQHVTKAFAHARRHLHTAHGKPE